MPLEQRVCGAHARRGLRRGEELGPGWVALNARQSKLCAFFGTCWGPVLRTQGPGDALYNALSFWGSI